MSWLRISPSEMVNVDMIVALRIHKGQERLLVDTADGRTYPIGGMDPIDMRMSIIGQIQLGKFWINPLVHAEDVDPFKGRDDGETAAPTEG